MGERATALARQVREAGAAFIATVEQVDDAHWARVPAEGVWSPGKDAEHVAQGAQYHQRIVRFTVEGGEPARGGGTVRDVMTAVLSKAEVLDSVRQQTEVSASLVEGLTDESLDLQAPPMGNGLPRTLEQMIVGQMIHHYDEHRDNIEQKLAQG